MAREFSRPGGIVIAPEVIRFAQFNLFAGYQHTADHNATTQSGLVPTAAERRGDFSQSVDVFGRPVRLIDPATGGPFSGNAIPQARMSPQAAALLGYYPAPNIDAGGRYDYETPVVASTHQDALQLRFIETFNPKNQLFGNVALQRTKTDSANLFAFVDASAVSGVDVPVNWTHRFSQFLTLRLRYQHTRLATHVTPYFANRENVAGNAGIGGDNQDPVNWGPPALSFSSGIAGLATAQYASNHDRTDAAGAETIWNRGRHNVTMGGDLKRRRVIKVPCRFFRNLLRVVRGYERREISSRNKPKSGMKSTADDESLGRRIEGHARHAIKARLLRRLHRDRRFFDDVHRLDANEICARLL